MKLVSKYAKNKKQNVLQKYVYLYVHVYGIHEYV